MSVIELEKHKNDVAKQAGDGTPRLKALYDLELRDRLKDELGARVGDAGAADPEDHAEHGRRRGEDRGEGAWTPRSRS